MEIFRGIWEESCNEVAIREMGQVRSDFRLGLGPLDCVTSVAPGRAKEQCFALSCECARGRPGSWLLLLAHPSIKFLLRLDNYPKLNVGVLSTTEFSALAVENPGLFWGEDHSVFAAWDSILLPNETWRPKGVNDILRRNE